MLSCAICMRVVKRFHSPTRLTCVYLHIAREAVVDDVCIVGLNRSAVKLPCVLCDISGVMFACGCRRLRLSSCC